MRVRGDGTTSISGRGVGNRVFAHVRGEHSADAEALTAKLQKNRDIKLASFDVTHVIRRHGLDETRAFEVEAAQIDAYPGVTNLIDGRASDERGLLHAKQVIERYEAPGAKLTDLALVISVNRTVAPNGSPYEAVRYAWRVDPKKPMRAVLVIPVQQELIVGVYVAEKCRRGDGGNVCHRSLREFSPACYPSCNYRKNEFWR